MTENAASNRPKKRYTTLFSLIFTTVFKIFLLSLLAWFLLLIWFGVIAVQKGTYVAAHDLHLLLRSHVEWIASKHLPIGYDVLPKMALVEVHIHDKIGHALESASFLLQKINQHDLINAQTVLTIMTILVETTEVVLCRVFTFILSLPLWASILFVMIVDGLVQRDIRKFQAARESTFLFHRLKLLTSKIFYSFFLIYMSMPCATQPQTLLLPMILIVSVLTMLSIKHYKKYV